MEIIDKRDFIKRKTSDFINDIDEDVYILGTNKYGISMCNWLINKGLNVKGYINDYSSELLFDNKPIYKSTQNYTDSTIINCIVEGRTIDAEKNISKINPLKSSNYFAIQFTFNNELIPVDFLINTDSIIYDLSNLKLIYNILEDEISRIHFEDLLNFRLNRDITFLKNFTFNLKGQYFENFITSQKLNSFIDGGGYDGTTSIEFISKFPNFKKIYYYEPTKKSMDDSIANLKNNNKIEFINKGLWDKEETLKFDTNSGSANSISEDGSNLINVTSIDLTINEKVDFIKLDIEGAEIKAILGAKETIEKYKPMLAICIYHKQTDFFQIPKSVLEINPNYKVFVRHYTQGVFETVMYFI